MADNKKKESKESVKKSEPIKKVVIDMTWTNDKGQTCHDSKVIDDKPIAFELGGRTIRVN